MTIDRVVGGLCILLGIGAIWHVQTLEVAFAADPVGPRLFPTIVGAVLALGGAILVFRPSEVVIEIGKWQRAAAVLAACLAYPLMLVPLGFVLATSALCIVTALAFQARPLQAAVSAVATAIVFFILLDRLLDLPLPRSPWGI